MAKIIDIVVDFETCSLSTRGAAISIAARVFERFALSKKECLQDADTFRKTFNLLEQFMNGREFSRSTQEWWQRQNDLVKIRQLLVKPADQLVILDALACYIDKKMEQYEAVDFVLWSQGSDFDIAILRDMIAESGAHLRINHHNIRDARTFCYEMYRIAAGLESNELVCSKDVYEEVPKPSGHALPHFPEYDCECTALAVWYYSTGITPEEVPTEIED